MMERIHPSLSAPQMSGVTEVQLKRAIQEVGLLLKSRQTFWETPRAIAMLALAFAAVFAAGGVSSWLFPGHPQQISVHLDQPLSVKVVP